MMALVGLEIQNRGPFADGQAFGDGGVYERIDGIAHFAADPTHPANQSIVDLDKAERDQAGRVHFLADFCILQPADPARANRRLLFDVLNRGLKVVPGHFNMAPRAVVPTEQIRPGDGFLMRHGWTVAWSGWPFPRSISRTRGRWFVAARRWCLSPRSRHRATAKSSRR